MFLHEVLFLKRKEPILSGRMKLVGLDQLTKGSVAIAP